ncbi:alpha-2-macroglobulin family protein [Terriglobus aquaticus]|uniref:Alpha-2-macroglobulin family protein n=1 Tax=Terriglobus aquaticus TaxID=940139 RepID=A0ABW9KLW1_9BACT|nr:alpha-2-macroglobulin family protein [Terriglobus aquaticus]
MCLLPLRSYAANPYFTLSTNRSFAPGTQPKLHLYTHDVDALEFRVYRVEDPEAFAAKLQEMHSFGDPSHAWSVPEQIDEKTWIERFHDWKSSLWHAIKEFFRTQFSRATRDAFKTKQSSLARRSVIVNAAQFAQIPLLNDRQLVARWRLRVPATFVSDNQILPISGLDRGMYLVEATDGHLKAYTVLLVSQTALVTRLVSGEVVTFVADRTTGASVPHASVSMQLGSGPIVRKASAADGTAVFEHAASAGDADTADSEAAQKLWFMARSGSDVALSSPFSYSFTQTVQDTSVAYVYTDRPVYRPGNTVHFKAILRDRSGNTLAVPKAGAIHVKAVDDADKTLLEEDLPLSAMGTIQGDIPLPADVGLGFARLTLTRGDNDTSLGGTAFRVEEYRKPEYQVQVTVAKPMLLQGESNSATVQARYFFGEPVSNGRVKYRVYRSRHYWWGDPTDADDDAAGEQSSADDASDSSQDVEEGDQQSEHTSQLDADGKLTVPIPTHFSDDQRYDTDYVVEAGVTDEAGREITARYRFTATHGSFRIHAQTQSYTVASGGTASVQVSAVDYKDRPVQTRIHVRLVQPPANGADSSDSAKTLAETDVNTAANGSATASLAVRSSANGSLRVVATAETPEHRTVEDSDYVWVSGTASEEDEDTDGQKIRILTDKKTYAPGDTAHVTLVSPVADVHVLFTATANAPILRKVLAGRGNTLNVDLPLGKEAQPNLTLDAVLVKNDKLYQGRRSVSVPPVQQRLQIAIAPVSQVFQPGQTAAYDVTTTDAAGRPTAAELSFDVVDEAIYSLYPDSSGDMVKQLYPDRAIYPEYDSSLTYYFTGEAGTRSPQLAMRHTRYGPHLAQVKPGLDAKGPRIRKDFPDTAFWQPAVRTDANGHARVSFSYPDSLTTWRTSVRAITASSQAGSAVNRVIVRKNIIVRMGQPRFLRKGDSVTVPVIAHNYLPSAQQVQLSLGATGLELPQSPPTAVALLPRADNTTNFRLRASAIGTATLTAKATGATEGDALQLSFPVEPDGVKQNVANAGIAVNTTSQNAVLKFPAGTDPAAHRLRLNASPSIAGTLFGALDYLTSFPYGCTEQTMSSFLPDLLVSKALSRLGVPLRESSARLHAQVTAGIQKLNDTHHSNGGWGWWQEDDSQVFMTAYVVSGLQQAVDAGYPEANSNIDSGADYLVKQLAQHPRMLPELRAFVVYALALHKRNVAVDLDLLYRRRADLSAQALAYTGLAMRQSGDGRSSEIATLLESKAKVQGELASWAADRNNLLDVDSDESAAATAFALKFLIGERPASPLLPKAAQWLILHRDEGAWWGSTYDSAFVLYGLTEYVAATQELNADLDVDIRVNNTNIAHRHFNRADALHGATLEVTLDATRLNPETNQVEIATRGNGRAYWSAQGEFYSTAKAAYQAGTMQLNIARDYYRLVPKQTGDHMVYTLQPLSGTAQKGEILAVHLGVSGSPQKYLLIEDPIAAGTEFVRNRSSYNIEGAPDSWTDWYTRQEFHDDRAAFFSTNFAHRQDLFYLVQVVNAGSFQISPARVMPMYQPGVQATTDTLHLDVPEVVR